MLSLAKTCAKQGVSFYRFLGDRFAVPSASTVPNLADLIRGALPDMPAREFAPGTGTLR